MLAPLKPLKSKIAVSVAGSIRMGTPFFHEFKKQASFFLREQIKNARLALTDVTPVELMTEEATNGNPWAPAPDAKTMAYISRAAFEIDDYWRIVEILHKRLAKFDMKQWREPYNALVLLEHLLTHGSESFADEFKCDREVIQELGSFQHIDERGFNWGWAVRKKSERVLKLLEKGPVLKAEREQARKVTRGIQGFGSFNQRWSNGNIDSVKHASDYFRRFNSYYDDYNQHEEEALEKLEQISDSDAGIGETSMKRDIAIKIHEEEEEEAVDDEERKGLRPEEVKLLLPDKETERLKIESKEDEHPFNTYEHQRMEMLLLSHS